MTAAVRSPLCPAPVSTRTLKALKCQHIARSQRLAALQIIQAKPQSVPANQGPQSKGNLPESIINNPHISLVPPAENNLQHNWDAPPGNSLWPHHNKLPPQQCFNKPDGSGPGYASLAPVHGCYNYQPLWQQPPPSKQQLTSSSEFGTHEASQPCFSNCNGASYHGYSQQLFAPNSFAYGAQTGYGNYQLPWQQLPPTLELPIGASWQHPPPPVQRQPTPHE